MKIKFRKGDKVIKNESTWIKNDFDDWGRGIGIGEVVEVYPDLDVRWDGGRCFENESQIILYKRRELKLRYNLARNKNEQ
jgi:hypothetical protein